MVERRGPLTADHWLCEEECRACHKPFVAGQYVALLSLGPGDDEEEREKCREGLPYNAVAIAVHWDCSIYSGREPIEEITND